MKTTTFENAKPGDRVWDILKGWGTVICISTECDDYPVEVKFSPIWVNTYTLGGKASKLVNGVEVPDISFYPNIDKEYYYPSPSCEDFYENTSYEDYEADRHRANYGLCYPFTDEGKEAAILHSKAMLGIS